MDTFYSLYSWFIETMKFLAIKKCVELLQGRKWKLVNTSWVSIGGVPLPCQRNDSSLAADPLVRTNTRLNYTVERHHLRNPPRLPGEQAPKLPASTMIHFELVHWDVPDDPPATAASWEWLLSSRACLESLMLHLMPTELWINSSPAMNACHCQNYMAGEEHVLECA